MSRPGPKVAVLLALMGSATAAPPCLPPPPSALVPCARRAPVLDGLIQAEEWARSARLPLRGARPSSSQTPVVHLLYAREGLYLAVVVPDTTFSAGQTPSGSSKHEEDVFEIFIDAAGDGRRYVELQIPRRGGAYGKSYRLLAPAQLTATGRLTPAYNRLFLRQTEKPPPPGLQWAVGSTSVRWVAEILLPWGAPGTSIPRSLRANFAVHDWRQPLGQLNRRPVFYYWSPVEAGCPHISPSRMGSLSLCP